ncbi:hypothetical protein [Paraflavitalea speifideaquila]|uniref:hypothetical protein n=1 Tax=Paraflavitalea speifideaquila TaxID=3076558 RepID=UPI0028E8B201|nr:hypothetical protein [Paraflavitalea speifideiaquila]
MKKLLIAGLILAGFSTATFAQTAPAVKKENPAKLQVVKKTNEKKKMRRWWPSTRRRSLPQQPLHP